MFEKMRLKSQIKKLQKEIAYIEQKRSRSQAALVEAILSQKTPDDADVDFFNRFTAEIDETRDKMHELKNKLDTL